MRASKLFPVALVFEVSNMLSFLDLLDEMFLSAIVVASISLTLSLPSIDVIPPGGNMFLRCASLLPTSTLFRFAPKSFILARHISLL